MNPGVPLPSTEDHLAELVARILQGLHRQADVAWALTWLPELDWHEARVGTLFELLALPKPPYAKDYPRWRREAVAAGLRTDMAPAAADGAGGRDGALERLARIEPAFRESDRAVLRCRFLASPLPELAHDRLAFLLANAVAAAPGPPPQPLTAVPDSEHALALLRRANRQLHLDELRLAGVEVSDMLRVEGLAVLEPPVFLTLFEVLDRLGEPHRSIVRELFEGEGEGEVEDVAERHGTSPQAVYDSLHRVAALIIRHVRDPDRS
ncbi:MAG: hypothetical protein KDE27_15130 [Planctomycetes bacterium]|nr:hypothetical protein [Planctomycetota bacterium]